MRKFVTLLSAFFLTFPIGWALGHTPSANQNNCAGPGRSCDVGTLRVGSPSDAPPVGGILVRGPVKANGFASDGGIITLGLSTADTFTSTTGGYGFGGTGGASEGMSRQGSTLNLSSGASGAIVRLGDNTGSGAGHDYFTCNAASGCVSPQASGSNAIALSTNGARIDVGTGASDYIISDGTNLSTPAGFQASSFSLSGTWDVVNDGTGQALTRGYKTDGATTKALRISSGVTLSTAGASIVSFENNTTQKARVDLNGLYLATVQTLTVANNAVGASPATATLTPTSQYVNCTCNDPDGCAITMGETGVQDGTTVEIIASTTTACTFADTAGVSELSGALTLGQYDTLRLLYLSDRWVQISTTNN